VIRVLVAEDSHTVRQLLVELLQSDPEITVVAEASNGAEAVELADRLRPDLITMDVHMPLLDGLGATKAIMTRCPAPIVIVSASSSKPDVERALSALRAGALAVVEKPDNPLHAQFNGRRERLIAMVKAMSQVKVVRRWSARRTVAGSAQVRPAARVGGLRVVAMAASTGGPAVLQRLLGDLPGDFPVPILVVQHIATGFIAGLAEWLDAGCDVRVKVAEHGEPLVPHTVYLAPDDRHLRVAEPGRVALSTDPPIGGFRPSGTALFGSAAAAFGPGVAAVILTGMGSDGAEGLKAVRAAGGYVIAQDEASSIVYGMPQRAVEAGVVDEEVAADAIGLRLAELARRGRA
jgi:two-component system chemotaxis response regulator CheB